MNQRSGSRSYQLTGEEQRKASLAGWATDHNILILRWIFPLRFYGILKESHIFLCVFLVSASTLINTFCVLEAQVREGCVFDLYTQPPHLSDRRTPLRGVCWITLTDACLRLPLVISAAPRWELSSAVNTISLCHPGESQKTAFWRVTVQQTQTRLFC